MLPSAPSVLLLSPPPRRLPSLTPLLVVINPSPFGPAPSVSPPITCPSAPKKEGTSGRAKANERAEHGGRGPLARPLHAVARWPPRPSPPPPRYHQSRTSNETNDRQNERSSPRRSPPTPPPPGRSTDERARPQRDRARARSPARFLSLSLALCLGLSVKLFHFLRVTTSTLKAATRSAAPPGAPTAAATAAPAATASSPSRVSVSAERGRKEGASDDGREGEGGGGPILTPNHRGNPRRSE